MPHISIFAFISLFMCFATSITGCMNKQPSHSLENAIKKNSQHMSVTYQVISNTKVLPCNKTMAGGECYASQLQLTFSDELPATGWEIVFSHLSPIQSHDSEYFTIKHMNGDLHRLTPIKAIPAKQTLTINLQSSFWSVSASDVLPNYFFVYNEDQTAVIVATQEVFNKNKALPVLPHVGSFTSDHQIKRNHDDQSTRSTARKIFKRNQQTKQTTLVRNELTNNIMVVPSIKQTTTPTEWLDVSAGFSVTNTDKQSYFAAWQLIEQSTLHISDKGIQVKITTDENNTSIQSQGYSLSIHPQKISINSRDEAGAFYALISLSQLVSQEKTLPLGEFVDAPRYSFRGVHLDVSRNFRSVKFVKTLIKQMANIKLNKLHLHLADDEGWRLAINGLDELTQVGGFRCYDPSETQCLMTQLGSGPNRESSANGYYSQADYRHLLQFAAAHHIEIIPSLDMPGHSRAAIKSMEARYRKLSKQEQTEAAEEYLLTDFKDTTQYSSVQHYNDNTLNPCLKSTYHLVDKVLTDLIAQHEAAGVPMKRYHIGADETAGAWHHSPVCEAFIQGNTSVNSVEDLGAYFVNHVAELVQSKGIIAAGWSDGMREFTPNVSTSKVSEPMQVNVWDALMWQGHKAANDFAQNGWHTILSYPDVLYFDFPYDIDPNEPGYYWATRATDSYKVFQFMPEAPEQNARLWTDRQGKPYVAERISNNEEKVAPPSPITFEGIQAHLWTEIVRHDTVAQYMYFPRLFSFAEKAWSTAAWETQANTLNKQQLYTRINQSWRVFSQTLVQKQLPLLAKQGVQFRLPPPGATIQQGVLHMNHLYEGMTLQYKNENNHWKNYNKPVHVKKVTAVRALLPYTNRVSAALAINP